MVLLLALALVGAAVPASAQSTAFTYQGRLNGGGGVVQSVASSVFVAPGAAPQRGLQYPHP
jgi:hypothetical protein